MKDLKVCLIPFLLLILFLPYPAHAELMNIHFDQTRVSAKLDKTPLDEVLERFGRERGIWFRGIENLSNAQITVEFSDLPMEAAMKRMLREMNYIFVFEQADIPIGVIILGHKRPGLSMSTGRHFAFSDTIIFEGKNENTDSMPAHDCTLDRETATVEDSIGKPEIADNDVRLDLPLETELMMASQDNSEKNSLLESLLDGDGHESEDF